MTVYSKRLGFDTLSAPGTNSEIYTVPAGKLAIIKDLVLAANAGDWADCYARLGGGLGPFFQIGSLDNRTGSVLAVEHVLSFVVLDAADVLFANYPAGSGGGITVCASGYELSLTA